MKCFLSDWLLKTSGGDVLSWVSLKDTKGACYNIGMWRADMRMRMSHIWSLVIGLQTSWRSHTLDAFVSVNFLNFSFHSKVPQRDIMAFLNTNLQRSVSCCALWKEWGRRITVGREILTHQYWSTVFVNVVWFLQKHLLLCGKIEALGNMSKGASGLFLFLLD